MRNYMKKGSLLLYAYHAFSGYDAIRILFDIVVMMAAGVYAVAIINKLVIIGALDEQMKLQLILRQLRTQHA